MAAMIAGVSTIRGDTDIAPLTIRHMFAQGVDTVWVAVGDQAAWDAVSQIQHPGLHLVEAFERYHRQQHWTDKLAEASGAEWIIPFDADEFWIAPQCGTLRAAVEHAPTNPGTVLEARLWHHQSWDEKVVPAERLPKVAYRWQPGCRIGPGNHSVSMDAPEIRVAAGIEIRHLQYRSFEQFCAKVQTFNKTLLPEARARGDSAHHTRLDGASDAEMRAAWDQLWARQTVHDPIPAQR
jgi:hypothetical protein